MSLIRSTCCGLQPHWFGGWFKHCEPPECCCGCCSALRPRYKRLVDNVFPAYPQDGLVKSNMEKLTFYASSSPEKLDRIGDYLAQKTARDLARHRMEFVKLAMEVMDQILVACRAQSLNLFVESFLKTVQQLLESQDPHMQLLATQSFVNFANIEEDTPSYHRRYDFFVSKFSALCHNNDNDENIRRMLRIAGLNGIKGVIRKTVSDDLQADIWDKNHMDKIVPSLLYNIQDRDILADLKSNGSKLSENEQNPAKIAEVCLRELVGRASFGNIESVIRPVLKHLDNHMLWDSSYPDGFAPVIFKIIMDSIQPQHYHEVIQKLMNHLDEKCRATMDDTAMKTREKTGIVNVLSQIVAIAASESIGPSVHVTINSLLNHLRNSIHNCENGMESTEDEKRFQDSVINTLAEFANNLPDFQKIETMVVIINKVPPISSKNPADIELQDILLKSLLKVSSKYRTVNMAQAFKYSFLRPLLSMSLAADAKIRLTVQYIFHQLLDRHDNLPKLLKPISLSECPELTMEKAHRQDLMFMSKHGSDLLMHIYENAKFSNNTQDHFDAIFTTLALLCVEMSSEEILSELFRVTFALQDLCLSGNSNPGESRGLSEVHKSAIHGIVAGFFHLTAGLTAIPLLCSHVEQIIALRGEKCPNMLPEYHHLCKTAFFEPEKEKKTPDEIPEELLFSKSLVAESLRSSGHDTTRLLTPFVSNNVVVDASMSRSASDLNSINVEVDSNNSSPRAVRRFPGEDITFESIRRILYEPPSVANELREERRLQILERFETESFESLIAQTEDKGLNFQHQLNDIFNRVMHDEKINVKINEVCSEKIEITTNPFAGLCNLTINPRKPPLFAVQFPELFVC